MKLIIITGPESSGKTTLAEKLHQANDHSVLVPEYARIWLEEYHPDGNYSKHDVRQMFDGQVILWKASLETGAQCVIWDTDPLVYKIWLKEMYNEVWSEVEEWLDFVKKAMYILCKPDLPWEYDPLRSNPHDRDRLFELYKIELEKKNIPFIIHSNASSSPI
ncbi:MAG: AAA family ATPase [Flavobacteriales bacterium]